MKKGILLKSTISILLLWLTLASCTSAQTNTTALPATIYEFEMKSIEGTMIPFSVYKGKVLLIVNTASGCGYTPQYEGLQTLYKTYQKDGFEVLAFPCNQFANQESGTEKEIAQFCSVNYSTTFQLFSKIDVNGKDESPLYTYLKTKENGKFEGKIKWNFTKFLIDKNGTIVQRYSSSTKPEEIEADIKNLLSK
ncbi:MAG: glutathione peroxidase [Bacteroidales bacterium]|nr:glutathione peroxidase [Bacteroidales bacterium]